MASMETRKRARAASSPAKRQRPQIENHKANGLQESSRAIPHMKAEEIEEEELEQESEEVEEFQEDGTRGKTVDEGEDDADLETKKDQGEAEEGKVEEKNEEEGEEKEGGEEEIESEEEGEGVEEEEKEEDEEGEEEIETEEEEEENEEGDEYGVRDTTGDEKLANGASGLAKSSAQKCKLGSVTFKDFNFGGVQEIRAAMAEFSESHQEEKVRLLESYVPVFPYWRFQLGQGFNLLFYGLGSKKDLLERFAKEALTDGAVIVVNGFLQDISLKQVLAVITETVWQRSKKQRNGKEKPSASSKEEELLSFLGLQHKSAHVHVVIHNIDGPGLRTFDAQRIFAAMAACSCVHLVASIDNVNSPLLWDKQVLSPQFNWWWHHTPTYNAYLTEAASLRPSLTGGEDRRSARSAAVVLKSLTPNARSVFRVLAEAQIAPGGSHGLPFHRWYTLCREKFLVSSEPTLRTHQTEFRDHELLRTRRGKDGQDSLYITIPTEALSKLLEEMDEA